MKKILIILLSVFLAGCVVSQQRNAQVYDLSGKWKISWIERDGKLLVPNFDPNDLILSFEGNNFKCTIDGLSKTYHSISDEIFFTIENGKIILDNLKGEKLTADIEFFNPTSFRASNINATSRAAREFLILKSVITGELIPRNKNWGKNSLHFSKVQNR